MHTTSGYIHFDYKYILNKLEVNNLSKNTCKRFIYCKLDFEKQFIMKSTIQFWILTLTTLLVISCSNDAEINVLTINDTALIDKIEVASKEIIDVSNLPSSAKMVLDQDFADSSIESIQYAKGLGYKVSLFTNDESIIESKSDLFFSSKGEKLDDDNVERKAKRQRCFGFVFPIDFLMPDDTVITLNNNTEWSLVREWYKSNSGVKKLPSLSFPVNIRLQDGTIQTLLDRTDLAEVKDACKLNQPNRKCFELKLPVSFTMPDSTVIVVSNRTDYIKIRRWHLAHPRVLKKSSVNFPINIIFKDGSEKEIANMTELAEAKSNCKS